MIDTEKAWNRPSHSFLGWNRPTSFQEVASCSHLVTPVWSDSEYCSRISRTENLRYENCWMRCGRPWRSAIDPKHQMRFLAILLLVLLLGLAWAMAPAGSIIRNQASAVVDGQTYLSNEIETVVQAVCSPSLTPGGSITNPGQQAITLGGGFAYFAYLLKNSGNDRFVFNMSWAQDGAAWSPSSVKFYRDINGNARRDSGEPEVAAVSLAVGEELRLVMEIQVPTTATNTLHITPVATCPNGTSDSDNYSQISIGSGPALNLSKTVDLGLVSQDQEVSFSVRVVNLGNQKAVGPVYVSDTLNTPELSGLSYVTGSANAPKGSLEYSTGSTWSSSATSVQAIRLVLSGLEAGEDAFFSFRMKVAPNALAGVRRNMVRAEGSGGPATAVAQTTVATRYVHALGPINNPRATSTADRQVAAVLAGQPYCFRQTLTNDGNLTDTYNLNASGLPSGIALAFQTLQGSSLPQPIVLGPGERRDFQVCLSVPVGMAPLEFVLSAVSLSTGNTDPTIDQITQVLDVNQIVLRKSKDIGGNATPGERVIYTLRVENPLPISLSNVFIEDVLDKNLEFVSASDGGSYNSGSRMVRWSLAQIAAGSTTEVTLTTKVADTALDNTQIPNRFSLRSTESPNPLLSSPVIVEVLGSALLLQKKVDPQKATYGDVLTYTLEVANVGRIPLGVELMDKPSTGLVYIAGSAVFNFEPGTTPAEPVVGNGQLVWRNLVLDPPDSTNPNKKPSRLTVIYKMRVVPGAPENLENIARATGSTATGSAVATAVGLAVVKLERGVFAPANLLVGRVFLDVDKDGKYTPGLDIPLPGARVVLANGLQALTDTEGRYSFRDLAGGVWEVFLDPVSAPFPVLPHPEQMGDGYRHRVRVEGLTTTDFPLLRPTGLAKIARETTLEFGPLKVSKKLIPLPNGIRVELVLSSTETLTDLTLSDPLPGGGEKTFQFEQFQGTQTFTYDLSSGYLTDPQARWKYP